MTVLGALMIYYKFLPGIGVLLLPLLISLTFLCAVGVGLCLSALSVEYRDIRYAIPFLIQIWMFVLPVIYPVSILDEEFRWLLALNPMAGIINAYGACLLGHNPIDWFLLGISASMIIILFLSGVSYFRKMEKTFADVI